MLDPCYMLYELHDAEESKYRDVIPMGPYETLKAARKDMVDCMADAIAWDLDISRGEMSELRKKLSGKIPIDPTEKYAAGAFEGVSYTNGPGMHWIIIEIEDYSIHKPKAQISLRPKYSISDILRMAYIVERRR